MQDLQRGSVYVTDPWKDDAEFQAIFTSIYIGDPSVSGSNGNLSGTHKVVTTPATANQEFAVAHGMTTAPTGVLALCPLSTGGGTVRLRFSKAADSVYVYLKCPDAEDAGVKVSLYFFGTL